jgi:DnaJ-class molecular chaperone
MSREGPPGRTMEMVWAKCPQCSGIGSTKDSTGKSKPCARCSGKGQVQTR